MGFGAWLPGTKLTSLSRPSATSGAPHRQYLFLGDSYAYMMRVYSAARWSILTSACNFRQWRSLASTGLALESGLWETVGMATKRTKSDKAQRRADQLDRKARHPGAKRKKTPRWLRDRLGQEEEKLQGKKITQPKSG